MAAVSRQACMGGWCERREHCERYHQAQRDRVSERLCRPGQFDAFQIHVTRPQTWVAPITHQQQHQESE